MPMVERIATMCSTVPAPLVAVDRQHAVAAPPRKGRETLLPYIREILTAESNIDDNIRDIEAG